MKKEYIAPLTEKTEVELEQGFMTASVVDKEEPNSDVTAGSQQIDENFDFTDQGQNVWGTSSNN